MTDWMRTQDEKAEAFEAGRADECASWQHSLAVLLPPEYDCTPGDVAEYIRRLQAPRRGGADLTKTETRPTSPLAPERRPELRGDRHE